VSERKWWALYATGRESISLLAGGTMVKSANGVGEKAHETGAVWVKFRPSHDGRSPLFRAIQTCPQPSCHTDYHGTAQVETRNLLSHPHRVVHPELGVELVARMVSLEADSIARISKTHLQPTGPCVHRVDDVQ
jgi:hypothetical protein